MKTEHTPEPWAIFDGDPRAIVTVANPMLSLLSVDDEGMAIMFEQSDARRIVACVNACAGIPDEQLYDQEPGCLLSAMVEQEQEIMAITKQRDELLANAEESDAVRDRLAKLLSETAIALKGEEEALQRHSWHDLPVVALAAMLEITILKQQRDELLAALEQFATWGRMQHRAQSKGCHATFDMMALKDEIDLAEAAIASVKEKA